MKNRKLVLSTNNINKVKEIRKILEDLPIEVLSKRDIGLGDFDIIEDGNTIEENSIKKAKALAKKTEYMVMADDSGLFVDVLKGEPGVYSSRYGGEEGNDQKNKEKLLKKLKDIDLEDRTAKFKAVITLITEEKKVISVEGECRGYIGLEARGDGGFGYDPIFLPEGYNQTFAQLNSQIKNTISHRAKALEDMKEILTNLLKDDQ